MSVPPLEILDSFSTELGPLCLRRRALLGREGVILTDVTLDHELLMSSWHTASEEALATRSVEWHGGEQLEVLVGGLGLGYTAAAALRHSAVRGVRVVEYLQGVIDWVDRGLIPLSDTLRDDSRLRIDQGDVYAELTSEATQRFDLLMIDVDHSPKEALGPTSQQFYTATGLAQVRRHLKPGGILAIWSAEDDPEFLGRLRKGFREARLERVRWENDLIDDGEEVVDFLFLARD